MSAPWPRHSLREECVKVHLRHHTGWLTLIPRLVTVGKVFTREFSLLGGKRAHTFWGEIVLSGEFLVTELWGSLCVGDILIPWWGDSFLLGEEGYL